MLSSLIIKNIAVISEATLNFSGGLNVFTGETGAGKTILIHAINAVLGGRTPKDIIRTGERSAAVTAVFSRMPDDVVRDIQALGYGVENGGLTVSREIWADSSKGGCRVQGKPVTVAALRELGGLLINLHGQQDNQQLLSAENHIAYIDGFGGLERQVEAYRQAYRRFIDLKGRLDSLDMDESLKAQRVDLLTFQISEITAAELTDGEEEELVAQRKLIRNAEHVLEALNLAQQALLGGEDGEGEGILSLLDALEQGVSQASHFVEELAEYPDKLKETGYELQELSGTLRDYMGSFDFNPRQLDAIEGRLDLIYRLRKKYGATIADILAHGIRCQEELDTLSFSEEKAEKLREELIESENAAQALADELSVARQKAAEAFIARIQEELVILDMPRVKLSLFTRRKPLSLNGCDDMELLISPNIGETPRPLAKIASGGEVARIMLAVKHVLADKDRVCTLIFDEVDTGVSGRAAGKIGRKLAEVARNRQVLCVTHLAQVAACGERHLYITKSEQGGRTHTAIRVLDRRERVAELARITAGDNITHAALQAADELLRAAGQ